MNNKLGLNRYRLIELERKIVNLKLDLIDETFSFNENDLNLNYLVKLNEFLFKDFYFDDDIGTRNLEDEEIFLINKYLNNAIKNSLLESPNIEEILDSIADIWNLQPFLVGNTRTLLGFLKILDSSFHLNLNVDVNQEINSNPKIFRLKK